jgi:hypothetical protein
MDMNNLIKDIENSKSADEALKKLSSSGIKLTDDELEMISGSNYMDTIIKILKLVKHIPSR